MSTLARPAFGTALRRLDLLLHRETLRLRMRYRLSLDELRGLYIGDEQVDAMIAAGPAADPDADAAGAADGVSAQDAGPATAAGIDIAELSRTAAALRGPALAALAADPAWAELCRVFGLTPLQQEVLLVAVAPELDPRYETLYAYLNNDVTRKLPTPDLVHRLLADGDGGAAALVRALSPLDRLAREGLLETVPPPQPTPRLHLGLAASPVLVQFLLGGAPFAERLRPVADLTLEPHHAWGRLAPSRALADELRGLGQALGRRAAAPVIVLEGRHRLARALARNLLAAADLPVLRVDLAALGETGAERGALLRLLRQAALLAPAGLLLDGLDGLATAGGAPVWLPAALETLLASGLPACIPVASHTAWRALVPGARLLALRVPLPDAGAREGCWRTALAEAGLAATAADVGLVADLFALDAEQIQAAVSGAAVQRAGERAHAQPAVDAATLAAAAKTQSFGDIGRLAERIETGYRRADLVLPPAVAGRIDELIAAVRHRRIVFGRWGMQRHAGRATGITALFAGASGTGKTMSASVIANELGLDLYRIELAGVVSKYIGETEKNLERIFAAAAGANCILLFDEADALFGKRSEVKDSHDRYANIEVAYLLQRMESHDGIVILTTNMAKGIDQAFSRRIQFVVDFPRPDQAARERLWAAMLAGGVPLADDLDLAFLARHLESSGGEIRNIALDAALLAAARPEPVVDMALLVRAAARQMHKQGRVPTANEFKHYFHLVKQASP
jgi:hypothetical protein